MAVVVVDEALMNELVLEFGNDAVAHHDCDERITSSLRPCG